MSLNPIAPGGSSSPGGSVPPELVDDVAQLKLDREGHAERIADVEADLDTPVTGIKAKVSTLENIVGAAGFDVIQNGAIYNVPADFATVTAALDHIRARSRAGGARVTIRVTPGVHAGESFVFSPGEDMSWVQIESTVEPAVHSVAGGGVCTVAGAQKNWSITIPLEAADAGTYSVGDFVQIWAPSRQTSLVVANAHGAWEVSAVAAGSIVVKCPSALIMTGFTVADLKVAKIPVVFPTAGHGVVVNDADSPVFKDCIFKCTTAANASTLANQVGIWCTNGGRFNAFVAAADDPWSARFYVAAHGFYRNVFATLASSMRGRIISSAAANGGTVFDLGSRADMHGYIETGSSVHSISSALISNMSDGSFRYLICAGGADHGLVVYFCKVAVSRGTIAGKVGSGSDVYASRVGKAFLEASTFLAIGTTSPAVNNSGNNDSYIYRG